MKNEKKEINRKTKVAPKKNSSCLELFRASS